MLHAFNISFSETYRAAGRLAIEFYEGTPLQLRFLVDGEDITLKLPFCATTPCPSDRFTQHMKHGFWRTTMANIDDEPSAAMFRRSCQSSDTVGLWQKPVIGSALTPAG